jgi:hypothetical protein
MTAQKNTDPRNEPAFDRLKWSLQALALPARDQIALFPDFVCRTDELALDFDDARVLVLGGLPGSLTSQERDALNSVDTKLATMSKGGAEFTEAVWSDQALFDDPCWAEVRALASAALRAFGWAHESPPLDPSTRGVIYVTGR